MRAAISGAKIKIMNISSRTNLVIDFGDTYSIGQLQATHGMNFPDVNGYRLHISRLDHISW